MFCESETHPQMHSGVGASERGGTEQASSKGDWNLFFAVASVGSIAF